MKADSPPQDAGHRDRASPQDRDTVQAGNPAEKQRRRITQHGDPAGAVKQHQFEGWLGQSGIRRDDKRAGIEPALGGDQPGGASFDPISLDHQLAGPVIP